MNLAPPAWSAAELDALRGVFALAYLWSLDGLRDAPGRAVLSHPQGWARWLPLRRLTQPGIRRALHALSWVALAAYLLDRGTTIALVVLSAVLVVEVTRENSSGGGGHRHHLLATVATVQLAASVTWQLAGPGQADASLVLGTEHATMAWWSVQAIVGVYFVSGVAKLSASGGTWVHRSPGLLVRALSVQTAAQMRPSGRKRAAARRGERIVAWLLPRAGVTRTFFGAGLVIELVAPIGLLDPALLAVVGIALLALHVANGVLLGLPFMHWQLLVFAFLVNPARLLGW